MTKRLRIDPRADRDVDEEAAYIAQDSLDAALRFLDAAHQTFSELLEVPGKGKVKELSNPRLSGIRQWRVTRIRELSHLLSPA
jgi:plasmid stabilization system protein ParE